MIRVLSFDGTRVTYEVYEPRWSEAELSERHQRRLQALLRSQGLPARWDKERTEWSPELRADVVRAGVHADNAARLAEVPEPLRDQLFDLATGDNREARGWDRKNARTLFERTVTKPLDKVADQLGVPTNNTGWEELTLQALRDAPSKGRVAPQITDESVPDFVHG